ncbi:hypothetical protein BJ165DRAFT_1425359 [Panaeolus papilionaceus]|nr:hypothetical protein BJ165DRAFT_1425359 [Panaeolus papilionaceus]
MALDIHGMGGFIDMQGPYVSGPSQNVQVAGANTLLPNTQTTGLYNFPPPTYYNPAPGGYF